MIKCKTCLCNNCDYGSCKESVCKLHRCNKEQKIIKLAFPIKVCEEYIDKSLSIITRVKKVFKEQIIRNKFLLEKRGIF